MKRKLQTQNDQEYIKIRKIDENLDAEQLFYSALNSLLDHFTPNVAKSVACVSKNICAYFNCEVWSTIFCNYWNLAPHLTLQENDLIKLRKRLNMEPPTREKVVQYLYSDDLNKFDAVSKAYCEGKRQDLKMKTVISDAESQREEDALTILFNSTYFSEQCSTESVIGDNTNNINVLWTCFGRGIEGVEFDFNYWYSGNIEEAEASTTCNKKIIFDTNRDLNLETEWFIEIKKILAMEFMFLSPYILERYIDTCCRYLSEDDLYGFDYFFFSSTISSEDNIPDTK